MFTRRLMVGMSVCVLSCGIALGQGSTKQPPKPAKPEAPAKVEPPAKPAKPDAKAPSMEDYAKASQPGDAQKALEQLAGSWDAVNKWRMTPDAPWIESKGSERGQMWYEGRYLYATYKGDMGGEEFKGLGITGYNNATKQYECTWIDNMSTGILEMTGSYDPATKTFTFSGECKDPVTGKTQRNREVTKISSADKHVCEFYQTGADGKEFKCMEITYTRKADAADKDEPAKAKDDKAKKDDKPAKK